MRESSSGHRRNPGLREKTEPAAGKRAGHVSPASEATEPEQGRSLIDVDEVSHNFGDVQVLDSISISIKRGERVVLLGPSGCGKSTLMQLVGGLLKPSRGRVTIDGEHRESDRLRHSALMPQNDLLFPWRTAIDNACIGLENRGVRRAVARDNARPLFAKAGLAEFEDKRPAALSGGMRQRVAFLRTLLADKDIILLDEPFGALDSITRAEMQEWLGSLIDEEERTMLLVTHDVEEAVLLGDRVLVFSKRPGKLTLNQEVDFRRGLSRKDTVVEESFVQLKHKLLEALE